MYWFEVLLTTVLGGLFFAFIICLAFMMEATDPRPMKSSHES